MSKKNKYPHEISEERKTELKSAAMALVNGKESQAYYEEELVALLGLEGKEIGTFITCLDELEKEGQVVRNRKGRYMIPRLNQMIAGIVQKNRRGFAFLIPDDGSEDVFIQRSDVGEAINGDHVLVRFDSDNTGERRSGSVYKVLQHNVTDITGTFDVNRRFAFVIPDDKRAEDVYVNETDWNGAVDGDKVKVRITEYPTEELGLRGRVEKIYGKAGERDAELGAIMAQYGLNQDFPANVLQDAESVSIDFKEEDLAGREDLRNQVVITIDGIDAKDLDDAVSLRRDEDGKFVLGVHIADVSHYVREDYPLDREAEKRGCSVYLLDAVVPMLPKQLSNGICSLNPNEDRLTLSVEMKIDDTGTVTEYRIFESVINSSYRMVYDDVSNILEFEDADLCIKYEKICGMLKEMESLSKILHKKRESGGSLDFDVDEAEIELDDKGFPINIKPAERRVANKMIEEFMLVANQTIAENYYWMEVPFVYRVHDKPSMEKMEMFKLFAGSLGYSLKGSCDNIHPKALREVLSQASGSDEENIINRIMLRSMKKAEYKPVCEGHFGLGFKYYCHFTSPIRRYPDLMIHRIIKELIRGSIEGEREQELKIKVEKASEKSSVCERNAVDAERTMEKKKKVQFMSKQVGMRFEGIISGVINSGFFVELENTIEGYVSAESLTDDYYEADLRSYTLIGEHMGKRYRVGNRVNIIVDRVDTLSDEIDFRMA